MSRASLRHLLLQGVAHLPIPTRPAATPPRILLLRPDHLGDLLFMTPALHALRTALPDAHVTCLVGPWGRPILANNPDVDELLVCDFPWFNRQPKPSPWQPYAVLWQEAGRLRRQRFDVAVIMRFDFWWGAALARLAGIGRRIGYAVPDVQPFLTEAVPYEAGRHEVVQNMRLVGAVAGFPHVGWEKARGEDPLRFTVTAADAAWAADRLPAGRVAAMSHAETCPYVAIHPGAGAAVKLWSVEGWAAVATELGRRYGATIVFTGGTSEVALVQSIIDHIRVPCINLAGQTNLGQLAAVFARCCLTLGPDSGPLHLAVAVRTPTVHLFGPIDPSHFGPWGDPARHVVVQVRFFDVPCSNRPCNKLDYAAAQLPQHTCMQTITVDSVLAAAESVLRPKLSRLS